MSIISPYPQSTEIKIYKGIPWGSDYSEIRWFSSKAQRQTYLNGKVIGAWLNCSIAKIGKSIKLTSQLNECILGNYMSFINYAAGSEGTEREFFCFITAVNYVSINCVEIEYTIDWVQSFLFDFRFGECFVEREHVNDDTMGKHTLPENMDVGELVAANDEYWTFEPAVMIQAFTDNTSVKVIGNVVDCTVSSGFNFNELGILADLLRTFNGVPEKIAQLVMIIDDMVGDGNQPERFTKDVTFTRPGFAFHFNEETYVPQNNKLGCAPYMLFTVDNFNGQIEQFYYEDFGDPKNVYTFVVEGQPTPKPCLKCLPKGYKNILAAPQFEVKFENFPQCPWLSDTFRAWVSQSGMSFGLNAGASIAVKSLSLAGNVAAGKVLGAAGDAASLLTTGAQLYEEVQNRKLHSTELHGSIANSGLDYARGHIGFRVTNYTIKPEAARRIDRRLTRYGYRVDETKHPNITGRKILNYVKCNGAMVDGDVPTEAKAAMESALNNGVTFWHTNNMDMDVTSNPIV